MLVDTHTHVQFRGFSGQVAEVMHRALENDVVVINVGTQKFTSSEAVEMLSRYPENVYAVVGLHPLHTFTQFVDEEESQVLTREEEFDYAYYKNLAKHEKVVGIGECGLDYYRLDDVKVLGEVGDFKTDSVKINLSIEKIKERQKQVFEAQIKLALELNKVLCIHTRPSRGSMDAYIDLYNILLEKKNEFGDKLKFEVHCYTGNAEYALKFVELGGFIGVNGILTFDKTGVSESVVEALPLNRILLETDAPYLTPLPFRGKRNEPSFVKYVALKIAQVKEVSYEEVEKITSENARGLFGF